jgi:hypothetical protein
MSFQTINIGQIANDGTGDDLRTAFEKIINNFDYLQNQIDDSAIGLNLSDTGVEVFVDKAENVFQFRTLSGSPNIAISVVDGTIVVNLDVQTNLNLNGNSLLGVSNITLNSGSTISGHTINATTINATEFNGVLEGPDNNYGFKGDIVGRNPNVSPSDPNYDPAKVDGVSVKDLYTAFTSFDFGLIGNKNITNPLELLLFQIGADMGTIANPAAFNIDAGPLVANS